MAISTKGVVAYKFYEKGGSNKDRFLEFLQNNILSIKNSENDYVLNIPYHPQTNPIESYFS